MPAPRIGIAPMTAAERQARHRAKLRQYSQTTPPAVLRRIPPRQDGGRRRSPRSSICRTNTAPGSTLSRPILKDQGWQRSC